MLTAVKFWTLKPMSETPLSTSPRLENQVLGNAEPVADGVEVVDETVHPLAGVEVAELRRCDAQQQVGLRQHVPPLLTRMKMSRTLSRSWLSSR